MQPKLFLHRMPCLTQPSLFLGSGTDLEYDGMHIVRLAVWLSGNALASINVVALRQTRLVSGWVTVCGQVNHLCM